MGGGDLNLKKSWHPSTLRNIERVWKAEQKHEAEQKKIEQLQRELADERAKEEMRQYAEDQGVVRKKGDRLDWMYQGPAALVDREQYLTGRTIDKTFEILEQMENKNQPTESPLGKPGAIFSQTNCNVTVDLANKIREDPLFEIRKRETDQKKQLLSNPIKMKQLRELLEQSLERKSKKKKRDKKRRKHSCESSGSDNSSEGQSGKKRKHKKKKKSSAKDKHEIKSEHLEYLQQGNEKNNGFISANKRENHKRQRSRSRSPQRSTSKHLHGSKMNREKPKPSKQAHIDPKEAEKRCKEMMEDAKKLRDQREKNIRRYKEDDEKRDKHKTGDKSTPDFIRPMLSKAATTGSVEARIKQKMYNIQRNSGAMNSSFARR